MTFKRNGLFITSLTIMSIFGISACNSGGGSAAGGATTVSNPATQSYSDLVSAAEGMSVDAPSKFALSAADRIFNLSKAVSTFGSFWTDTEVAMIDERTDTNNLSPQEWIGIQLDGNAIRSDGSRISALGRIKDSFGIYCALGVGFGSVSEIPANGSTVTITFSESFISQIESQCDIDGTNLRAEHLNESMAIELEEPENTGLYDTKVSFSAFNQVYYFRVTDNLIRIATSEVNTNVHQSIADLDKTEDILRFEYISGPNQASLADKNMELFRVYYDNDEAGDNDEGMIVASKYGEEVDGSTIRFWDKYIIATRPNVTGNKYSLSMASRLITPGIEYEACVNSDGTIDTDGIRCADGPTSVTGDTLVSESTLSNAISFWEANDGHISCGSTNLSTTENSWNNTNISTSNAACLGLTLN